MSTIGAILVNSPSAVAMQKRLAVVASAVITLALPQTASPQRRCKIRVLLSTGRAWAAPGRSQFKV